MAIPLSIKSHRRSHAFAFFGLVAGVCIITSTASAKGPWAPALDLEPSLRSAALVLAVRVEDVSEIRVVYGGKMTETLYQYTFEPIRVLKGVYSRPQLLMTNVDLRGYSNNFDPKDIQQGQQRLLLLGRSRVGYVNILPGQTADITFPRLSGRKDPLLSAVEVLLAQQEMSDRFASALASNGTAIGDKIGVFAPNCVEFAIAFFGILKAGAVVSTVNSAYTERELAFQMKDCGARVLLVHEAMLEVAEKAKGHGLDVRQMIVIKPGSQESGTFWGLIEGATGVFDRPQGGRRGTALFQRHHRIGQGSGTDPLQPNQQYPPDGGL